MSMSEKYLRPDSKGRITLGKIAKGVSSYQYEVREDGVIILKPNVEIPANEAWLYKNKEALEKVKNGLEDSANGRVKSRGSFAQYADEEIE